MSTLRIEHAISDFDTWRDAFGRFAARRKEGGVLDERIMQPVDDPHYVFIDLDFATVEAAQRFQQFLETQVWSSPANSPALEGNPRSRIVVTPSFANVAPAAAAVGDVAEHAAHVQLAPPGAGLCR